MVDQPGIEQKTLLIHGKEGTKEHKMNVPAAWHHLLKKKELPAVLVNQPGIDLAIVMNVNAETIGEWCLRVAQAIYKPDPAWVALPPGPLQHRLEAVMKGRDSPPVLLETARLDLSGQKIKMHVQFPMTRAVRVAIDAMCEKLGLSWTIPFEEVAPVVECQALDAVDNIFTRSRFEEARGAAVELTKVLDVPLPSAETMFYNLVLIMEAFDADWTRYTASILDVTSKFNIQVHFKDTFPSFASAGSPFKPFSAFKQAFLAEIPGTAWIALEAAFRVSNAGYELDMVSCLCVDQCIDGYKITQASIPRAAIAERRQTQGIIPLIPGIKAKVLDAWIAEIERFNALRRPIRSWTRGVPPPAFPDRLGEVKPLICKACGTNMTTAVYGLEVFVRQGACPSCHARCRLEFVDGEYASKT
jgi:hypothetical protein